MRVAFRALIGLALLVLVPASARAQASIAGVVKDTSGAVLPGVTVEAASTARPPCHDESAALGDPRLERGALLEREACSVNVVK